MLKGIFKVYNKGECNKNFNRNKVGSVCAVYDLGELGCPNLNKLKHDLFEESQCFYHSVNSHVRCAIRNVNVLQKWMMDCER